MIRGVLSFFWGLAREDRAGPYPRGAHAGRELEWSPGDQSEDFLFRSLWSSLLSGAFRNDQVFTELDTLFDAHAVLAGVVLPTLRDVIAQPGAFTSDTRLEGTLIVLAQTVRSLNRALTEAQKKIRKAFFNTPLGYSRLRRSFIERFRKDCPSGPVDATLFGLRMRFYPYDNQTDAKSAVCGACYNHRELKWLRRHLPKGGTFVDVGANMGFFSLYAAQREARVIAVEPNPVLFERLATNMRLNGMRADLLCVAVGDQESCGQLVQMNGDFGGGRIGAGYGAAVRIRFSVSVALRTYLS